MHITLTKQSINSDDVFMMEDSIKQHLISQGETTRCFEKEYARYLGAVGAVATSSGTSAILLALKTVGVKSGDEVIVPSYTCLAVLNAVIQAGARPVLIDNNYDPVRMDFNIMIEKVYAKISVKTSALIIPHMFGVAVDVDELVRTGIPVIEDITLSLGATCHGKPVGCRGMVSVCSFHASKMITCGEGGALAAMSEDVYERARYLNGWENEQAQLRLQDTHLPAYELRFNFHLSDVAAALGLSQLKRLPFFVERRRSLAACYSKALSGIAHLTCPDTSTGNVFFRYLVALEGRHPTRVIEEFAKKGIEVGRGVYPPLHRYLGESPLDFPGAERAVSSLISIPLYPALTDEEVDEILVASVMILREVT